ncbi:MAG: hypothetical protein M0P61_08580 [Ignavibacteriaceae bacterium]|jgi:hypothetical protein|nr:hypothetical protein [Ignavibacteriaceae bacterium]
MQEISAVQVKGQPEESVKIKYRILLAYIFYPIRAGLFGFALFFTTIFISKYIGYFVNNTEEFYVDMNDVILSLLGFVLLCLIKFLENLKTASQKK